MVELPQQHPSSSSKPPTSSLEPTKASHNPVNTISHLVTIKLNYDNYLLWRAQMVPFLKGQDLYYFVNGSCTAPASLDSLFPLNPLYLTWQQQDQAILSALISFLLENFIAHVLEATTSYEVWLILEYLFAAKSQARVMQL